jgi:hypothetical protein
MMATLLAQTILAGGLLSLLVKILILAIILGLLWYIITLIPLPAPFGQLVRVVFIVICVVILICILLPLAGISL